LEKVLLTFFSAFLTAFVNQPVFPLNRESFLARFPIFTEDKNLQNCAAIVQNKNVLN
jgi:hypothetical protein